MAVKTVEWNGKPFKTEENNKSRRDKYTCMTTRVVRKSTRIYPDIDQRSGLRDSQLRRENKRGLTDRYSPWLAIVATPHYASSYDKRVLTVCACLSSSVAACYSPPDTTGRYAVLPPRGQRTRSLRRRRRRRRNRQPCPCTLVNHQYCVSRFTISRWYS
jgi:hypothetical protein